MGSCRARHWFTRYGRVGERTNLCVRCGAPRPGAKFPKAILKSPYMEQVVPQSNGEDVHVPNGTELELLSDRTGYCTVRLRGLIFKTPVHWLDRGAQ